MSEENTNDHINKNRSGSFNNLIAGDHIVIILNGKTIEDQKLVDNIVGSFSYNIIANPKPK